MRREELKKLKALSRRPSSAQTEVAVVSSMMRVTVGFSSFDFNTAFQALAEDQGMRSAPTCGLFD